MSLLILDLPPPYEPVEVDTTRPLEEQFPAGPTLEVIKDFLSQFPEYTHAISNPRLR